MAKRSRHEGGNNGRSPRPPECQDQLFREFTRASGTVATGTGLGLYLVRSLVGAQGGTVEHHNLAQGGAVFSLSLPTV